MECHGRRGRRGRNRSRYPPCVTSFEGHNFTPCQSRPWSFLSGLASFLIMSSLMAIIYLMLEYHCSACIAKHDMNNITQNVEDIAKNLLHIQQSYSDLERQILKFSQELPKLEGQIEVLEVLANTIDTKDFGWNPKTHLPLPNTDVYLSKSENDKNVSRLSTKHYAEILAV